MANTPEGKAASAALDTVLSKLGITAQQSQPLLDMIGWAFDDIVQNKADRQVIKDGVSSINTKV